MLVSHPAKEELERDEVDVEALGEDATIRITERAAEVCVSFTRNEIMGFATPKTQKDPHTETFLAYPSNCVPSQRENMTQM